MADGTVNIAVSGRFHVFWPSKTRRRGGTGRGRVFTFSALIAGSFILMRAHFSAVKEQQQHEQHEQHNSNT